MRHDFDKKQKILVVGAGFSGSIIARELAEAGFQILVIDKRDHLGGNAFDYANEVGIRVHKYGPHLFHTSNMRVVGWLSKFTQWLPYNHKVKALLSDGRLVTLPVNSETSSIVGKDKLIDTFFRPYTKKMWGIELEELDQNILNRVPIRDDLNELYFPNDTFQALPKDGYDGLFKNILNHPNIEIRLSTPFVKGMEVDFMHTFNSMPIDEFFNYKYGELPYRSIKFHTTTIPVPSIFPVATVNYTHDAPYTRVTEWKKLPNHGDSVSHTTITVEEPCDYRDNDLERYYPVKDSKGKNIKIYRQYKAELLTNMTFIGRCGLYAYIDMHQAVSSALSTANSFIKNQDRK